MANLDQIMDFLADGIGADTTSVTAINSIEGTLYLYKDTLSKTVRGYCYFRKSSDIAFDMVIFQVPEGYRPLEEITRPCFLQTSSGVGAYYCRITTSGNIQQRMGSTVRSGFMVFEYSI